MSTVIFLKSAEDFPKEVNGVIYNPIEVVGGFIFEDTEIKRSLCKDYVIKEKSEIVFIQDQEFHDDGEY